MDVINPLTIIFNIWIVKIKTDILWIWIFVLPLNYIHPHRCCYHAVITRIFQRNSDLFAVIVFTQY